jgi:hypothetical protein
MRRGKKLRLKAQRGFQPGRTASMRINAPIATVY